MQTSELDTRIIWKISRLNGKQKSEVLNFLEMIPKKTHSTKRYRSKALKQIRKALNEQ